MSDRESFAGEAYAESVTLSEAGIALILLENEIANNAQAARRWSRRYQEAQVELQELKRQREFLTEALGQIKGTL